MAVQIDFISAATLANKTSSEKIRFILKNVREDRILVLETALTPQEEKELISQTMQNVSPKFPGIEVASLGTELKDLRTQIISLLGGKTAGLTVVGPSNLVKQIKKDPDKLRLITGS